MNGNLASAKTKQRAQFLLVLSLVLIVVVAIYVLRTLLILELMMKFVRKLNIHFEIA